jgi:predicted transcriptional regulator of viral defense system
MRCGRKKQQVDVPLMFRLWNDDTLRTEDVALQLGLSTGTLRKVASRHGLLHRVSTRSGEISEAPSEAEELLSQDSLALSPWVAARAEQFRRQKERHGEPARVQIGVTTLVTSGPRRRLASYDA